MASVLAHASLFLEQMHYLTGYWLTLNPAWTSNVVPFWVRYGFGVRKEGLVFGLPKRYHIGEKISPKNWIAVRECNYYN